MAQTADQRIREMLSDISQNEGVDILYAIESGSRAWGFESPDSDYDVRFIYREPAARAFALRPPRNVIEVTQPLEAGDGQSLPVDMVGWSLSKAIGLGLASNPQFAEWSRISEHYVVDQEFHDQMREIASHSSPRALAHHYRGLAKKTMHEYLNRDEDPVGKKYLYAVRPIMAAQWMLDNPHVGVTPPVPFEDLRKEVQVHRAISDEINTLLEWKVERDEERGRRRFPVLDAWIASEVDRLAEEVPALADPYIDPEVGEKIWERNYPNIFGVRSMPDPDFDGYPV